MKAKWSVNVIGEVTPWYRLAASNVRIFAYVHKRRDGRFMYRVASYDDCEPRVVCGTRATLASAKSAARKAFNSF